MYPSFPRTRESIFSEVRSLWIPAFAGMTFLGGCNVKPADKAPGADVPCALAGARDFSPACTVERTAGAEGTILTLHHPDGGFRRLLVMKDGQGVTAADGAEPAEVRMNGAGEIEVSLDGDRYRLPAKPKPAS